MQADVAMGLNRCAAAGTYAGLLFVPAVAPYCAQLLPYAWVNWFSRIGSCSHIKLQDQDLGPAAAISKRIGPSPRYHSQTMVGTT